MAKNSKLKFSKKEDYKTKIVDFFTSHDKESFNYKQVALALDITGRANQYMIEHSTHLIAYVSHPSVGSRMVFEAALARQKRGLMCVTNIAGRHPY